MKAILGLDAFFVQVNQAQQQIDIGASAERYRLLLSLTGVSSVACEESIPTVSLTDVRSACSDLLDTQTVPDRRPPYWGEMYDL